MNEKNYASNGSESEALRTSAASLELKLWEKILLRAAFKLFDQGAWKFLPHYDGDYPNMSLLDKVFWLYKKDYPIALTENIESIRNNLLRPGLTQFDLHYQFYHKQELNVSAAGDILPLQHIEQQSSHIYEKIGGDLFSADVSVANLEAPITTKKSSSPPSIAKKMPPRLAFSYSEFDYLTSYQSKRFSALSTINNHSMDLGIEGVDKTRECLETTGIIPLGTYTYPAPKGNNHFKVIDQKGIKLGFVAFSFGLNGNEPNPKYAETLDVANINCPYNQADLSQIKTNLKACRESGCDFVVLSLHWGLEFEFFPTPDQIKIAHELVEAGADLILGHHPHVIQPIEIYYPQRDRHRQVPICYSLGNLTTPIYSSHERLGLIINSRLKKGTEAGEIKTYLDQFEAIPVLLSKAIQKGKIKYEINRLETILECGHSFEKPNDLAQIDRYSQMII